MPIFSAILAIGNKGVFFAISRSVNMAVLFWHYRTRIYVIIFLIATLNVWTFFGISMGFNLKALPSQPRDNEQPT
jgi:hypothetical protein